MIMSIVKVIPLFYDFCSLTDRKIVELLPQATRSQMLLLTVSLLFERYEKLANLRQNVIVVYL